MRRLFFIALVLYFLPLSSQAAAVKKSTKQKAPPPKNLAGIVVKQKENNRLWYIAPDTKDRYFLKDSGETQSVIEALKIVVPATVLTKIPKTRTKQQTAVNTATKQHRGKFLTTTEDPNTVWYVHPTKNIRTPLGTPPDAWFSTLNTISETVIAKDIGRYSMNTQQSLALFDPLFSGVAYVAYDGMNFMNGSNDQRVLPLASLTKLMTALVVTDTNPIWSETITITPETIHYPGTYYPEGGTSEIKLKEGDTVTREDLLIALLVASSNQSADALATATGLVREEFIRRMNEKALLFGLSHTVFYDVAGLDVRNVSTPREMAILAERAFANPVIASTSVKNEYTVIAHEPNDTVRLIPVTNRNISLLAFEPEGAKSGYLVEAQRNAAIRKDGKIYVVMHARSLPERNAILGKLLASIH